MRQRSLGILGGALLVVGIALALASGIVAHSTGNRSALTPAGTSVADQRSEPGRPPAQRGEGPGPFTGGPGGRDLPGGDHQP
ncbi:MAG TPA: hypothetical protein VGU71_13730 [Candidatus Dormibacteraeota bacterium]|nr:hypothetical protein [Candidatus Dormibacteraeota bacterium]